MPMLSRAPALLLALAMLLAATHAMAIPASPHPIEFKNADGTTVMGRLFGDEHLSWSQDLDGWPLVYDKSSGAWHYATLGSDGRFTALTHRAGTIDPAKLGLVRHLKPTEQAPTAVRRSRPGSKQAGSPRSNQPKGLVRNLVLLVKFNCSDAAGGCDPVNQSTAFEAADFESVLNGETGSVRHYYREISYAQLDLVSEIATGQWIQLPKNDMHYVYNEVHPNGSPEEMIVHAVKILDAQGFDFTRFDLDGDGVLDAVSVIHVGEDYAYNGNPASIHSHQAELAWYGLSFRTHDGILIDAYHTESEISSRGTPTDIGTITHESAHFFGLPDLYDTTFRSAGLGLWSLMALGCWAGPDFDGTWPTHPDAWSRYRLGWTTPQVISRSVHGVRLEPSHSTQDVVRIDAGLPSKQFFLLENRQQDKFDTYLPASGLAIYHVDERRWSADACIMTWRDYCDNTNPDRYLVDLEQADGQRALNLHYWEEGDSGDVWPYDGRAQFTPTTTPNSLGYGQSTYQGDISILNIVQESNGDITFDVEIRGAPLLGLGEACQDAMLCDSGFCVDGVCCDTACDAGLCNACSIAAGASADGVCAPIVVCEASACVSTSVCDPAVGMCVQTIAEDGTECEGGVCQEGTCATEIKKDEEEEKDKSEDGGCGCASSSTAGAGHVSLLGLLAVLAFPRRDQREGRLS